MTAQRRATACSSLSTCRPWTTRANWSTRLGDTVGCYKVGLELLFGGGLEFAQGLKAAGRTVFLDFKLLDIGNTVEKAARQHCAARLRLSDRARESTRRR